MKSVATTTSLIILIVACLLLPAGVWAGQFTAFYTEVASPEYQEWQQELMQDRVLESLAADLNSVLTIPAEVTITVAECQTSNAFYSPQNQAITICYELIGEIYHGAIEAGWTEENAERAAQNATAFFFYHELGHALIHVLDLPITGMEEDAVDQLSVYVLAEENTDSSIPALDAATAFLAWSQEEQAAGAQLAFWDEHSLNQQRFFNIVCWVYGQQPDRLSNLVTDGVLPEGRAARCPHEWNQIDKSWSRLLERNLQVQ